MGMGNPIVLLAQICFKADMPEDQARKKMIERLMSNHITTLILADANHPISIMPNIPCVYVSIGGQDLDPEFKHLQSLPYCERVRWLHYDHCDEVQPHLLYNCWLNATELLPEKPPRLMVNEFINPLVSVFTAAYNAEEKLRRPYQSLLNQTYSNWQWVVMDDSTSDSAHAEHVKLLQDPRAACYRANRHQGYIGKVKRDAASLCNGEILVELDHDDELMPEALERIVEAFRRHPECGFVFGESAEVYWETKREHAYDWGFGFGFGVHYCVFVPHMNRWQIVARVPDLNWMTIRHLIGLPNHPRVWTKECYQRIGGHRPGLSVADDYDLLVRTFLTTKYVRIPHLLYVQYRNGDHAFGENTTFTRNAHIQQLCAMLEQYYRLKIEERLHSLNLPILDFSLNQPKIFEEPENDPLWQTVTVMAADQDQVSLIFPIAHGKAPEPYFEKLKEIINDKEALAKHELIVVGNLPPEIEEFAANLPPGKLRWWPMLKEHSEQDCIRYAKLCSSCVKQEVVTVKNKTREKAVKK